MTFRRTLARWLFLSALVMAFLLLCSEFVSLHEAFARAGGGGSSGGSSSSSSSTSGSGGTDTIGNFLTTFAALLGSAMALLHVILINRKINQRKQKISEALESMRQREPEWNEGWLEEQVRLKFKLLQDAWSRQDLEILKRNLTSELYQHWESQILEMRAKNLRNLIDQVEILNVRFVAVQNFIDNQKDNFTACIDAKCMDVLIPLEAQNPDSPKRRGKEKFREFWTFERDRGEWKLKSVWQWSSWSKFLNSRIVYELGHGLQIKNESASFQQINFQNTKNEVRKTKRLFLIVTINSLLIMGFTFTFYQPINPLDGLLKICIYSLPVLYLSFLLLRKKIFRFLENINANFSLFTFIISLFTITIFSMTSLLIVLVNVHADREPALTVSHTIINKYSGSRKGTKYYRYVVNSPLSEQCCIIESKPITVSSDRSEYAEIEVGHSKANLTIKKGFLGIPFLLGSQIIPLSPEEKKSALESKSKEGKRKPVRQWTAAALAAMVWRAEPITDAPTDFRLIHWSNKQLKSKEPIVNGQVHGVAEFRFSNGQLYGMIPFKNGQKHGQFALYREDGSLDQQLSYKEGVPHGLCKWYKPDGSLMQEAVYVEGQHTLPK